MYQKSYIFVVISFYHELEIKTLFSIIIDRLLGTKPKVERTQKKKLKKSFTSSKKAFKLDLKIKKVIPINVKNIRLNPLFINWNL
jgi:hypothetical protein